MKFLLDSLMNLFNFPGIQTQNQPPNQSQPQNPIIASNISNPNLNNTNNQSQQIPLGVNNTNPISNQSNSNSNSNPNANLLQNAVNNLLPNMVIILNFYKIIL